MSDSILRIGTRSSQLATWQANWVAQALNQYGYRVELVPIETEGDVLAGPLTQASGFGFFTRAIQQALLENRVDLAVHSLKDLPTTSLDGLTLAAVPCRAAPTDALVSVKFASLDDLPDEARVGTGSPRRRAQLLHHRNDLHVVSIRGNVDTRLKKLDAAQFDAIILARAGLERLGCADRVRQDLPLDICLPAPGQGAIGIETRCDDATAQAAAAAINHAEHAATTLAERTFLATIEAGCSSPVGALCWRRDDGMLRLRFTVVKMDGEAKISHELTDDISAAAQLGRSAAEWAIEHGASSYL